ncbi:MAG: hypothetical protein ACI83I_000008 [Bacteroidia bacterium]|jgi:hypothetical protein
MNSVKIFTDQPSARLQYIADVVLKELLGIDFEIINFKNAKLAVNQAGISYSENEVEGSIHIHPSKLLFEHDLRSVEAHLGDDSDRSIPHLLLDEEDFDPFAAAFYLVSRYEEHLPYDEDAHKRFPPEASCLVQLNILHLPLVNYWARELGEQFQARFPTLELKPRSFEFRSTIDVDQVWKYKFKGFKRMFGGLVRDIFTFKEGAFKQRLAILFAGGEDPFFNFNYQNTLHLTHTTDVTYFFQVGRYGAFDKNTSAKKKVFRSLISNLAEKHKLGVHPSYRSNDVEAHRLKSEIDALESITEQKVHLSRQHFLRMKLPTTYKRLIANGITEDYTCGYTSHHGFRAGLASSFLYYNFEKETVTNLRCFPFCLMDVTPLHYYRLQPNQAMNHIDEVLEVVKEVGGLAISLWHNESLSEDDRWMGWRAVYEHMVQKADEMR